MSVGLAASVAVTAVAVMAADPVMAGGPHALYIVDANSGAVLTDQSGSEPRFPASLTKMMTLYLTFDAIEAGRSTLKTKVKVSQQAVNAAPSKLELAVGDEITVEDAILALITKSANDVAIALAEHLGGSEANFAKQMTFKARDIGMTATTFKNASGLPDSSQTTTARDMVTLGLRLHDDHPRFFPLFSTKAFAFNGGTFKNHNTLMLQMPGINGIKTGYTHASGFNLVSSYQQDGKHLVGAIFGGETAGTRNAVMRIALTRALAKASATKTRKPVLVARRAEPWKSVVAKAPSAKPAATALASPSVAPNVDRMASAQAPVVPVARPPLSADVAQATPARAPLRIDVAKVRTVTSAPTPAPVATTATTPAVLSPGFAMADVLSRPGDRPTAAPAPVAVAATNGPQGRTPSSFEQQMASLAQNIGAGTATSAPASAPPAIVASAPSSPALPVAAARPPSSLGAQLAQLTQPAAPVAPQRMAEPSYRLKGPETVAPVGNSPVSGQRFEIQIGAYASAAEADRRLAATQAQVMVLRDKKPLRQTVTVGDKTLFRARFAGFDAQSAQAACAELQKQALNCLAFKAD
jgi:D-alanyl-D-alanine carboxypeptidase